MFLLKSSKCSGKFHVFILLFFQFGFVLVDVYSMFLQISFVFIYKSGWIVTYFFYSLKLNLQWYVLHYMIGLCIILVTELLILAGRFMCVRCFQYIAVTVIISYVQIKHISRICLNIWNNACKHSYTLLLFNRQ